MERWLAAPFNERQFGFPFEIRVRLISEMGPADELENGKTKLSVVGCKSGTEARRGPPSTNLLRLWERQ